MDPNNNNLVSPDEVVSDVSPLALPISDQVILQTIDYAEKKGKTVRAQYKIDDRATRNINFWKGNQVDSSKLDSRYQEAHTDNVARQDLENKIKLATGHVPDIFISPPDNQDFNMEAARDLQCYIRDRMTDSTMKRLLKNGLRKMDLELIGIIKCRYDPTYQTSRYELLDSKNVLFGEGAKIYEDGFTIDGTEVLFHYVEEATQQVLNKFPKKAAELMQQLSADGKEIPSRLRYTEASFAWYDRQGNCNQGVCWRYGTTLLDAIKHPYYDYDNPDINFFDRPRKNYILFSYSNLGETVYESTTDFEQAIPINRIINRRRRQITEIADRSVPKLAFLAGAMTKELASNISTSPNEAIILSDNYDGDKIQDAVQVIPAIPLNPILYQDLIDLRGRVDSIFATHGTTTGVSQGNTSGVSKQISREGDLVTSDDINSITLERVMNELCSWEMQFLRLFHDDDRPPLHIMDSDGETQHIDLTREKVEADIQVVVVSSSIDMANRRADALQMLSAQAIDPYTLLEDLNVRNPKERMRRLLAFINAKQSNSYDAYMEILGIDPKTPFASADDAQRDIDILRQGQQVQLRMPGEAYVGAFTALVKSPAFNDPNQFDANAKAAIQQHIARMKMLVDQTAQQQAAAGVNPQGAPGPEAAPGPTSADSFIGNNPFATALMRHDIRGMVSQY